MQKPTGTIDFTQCSIWIESRNLLTDFEIEESFRALQHLLVSPYTKITFDSILRHFSPDDLIFTKELSWALRVEWVTGDPLPVEWSGPQENFTSGVARRNDFTSGLGHRTDFTSGVGRRRDFS